VIPVTRLDGKGQEALVCVSRKYCASSAEIAHLTKYVAVAAFIWLCARPALAQNQLEEGLDLSDPKKEEPKKESEGLDLSQPPPTTDAPVKKPVVRRDDGPVVERDTTASDRVKSVQRKLYIKRGRFELAPSFVINVNDPYYTKVGASLRAAFYPADSFAIALRGTYLATLPSDDVRIAKISLQSRIFFSVPVFSVMADFEWSPLYGKVAFFNSILHVDGYLIGGGGIVYTTTSSLNRDASLGASPTPAVNPAFDLGIGLRFVARDFLAINLALINTAYQDIPVGTTKGSLQNLMTIQIGFALFVPFKSTFREAE
jgi:outer membrane beta-barrel protein